jgi:hypothetical protein
MLCINVIIVMAQFYCLPDSFEFISFVCLPLLGYAIGLYLLPTVAKLPWIVRTIFAFFVSIAFCFLGSMVALLLVVFTGGLNR